MAPMWLRAPESCRQHADTPSPDSSPQGGGELSACLAPWRSSKPVAALIAALAAFAFPVLAETPAVPAATPAAATTDDPYLWLEEVHGARALDWVEQQNARSLKLLKGDPRYEPFHQAALKIVNATDRIPEPNLIGTTVYNLWQDPTNVRGLWRRASPESYATAQPAWETVLDLDKLATDEKKNWIWHGANCPPPHYRRCLIGLSDGGEDADTVREFDLVTRSFVDGGFRLPRSKQTADWLDDDTLIVSRDWGPGTMTASSYPFIVKTLRRGQSLDQATEVFRGKPDDVGVSPTVLHDGDGHQVTLIVRNVDFFHAEIYQLTASGAIRLYLPAKVDLHGLLDGRLIFTTLEDWRGHKAGELLAYAPEDLRTAASADKGGGRVVFSPNERQSIEQVAVTAHRLVAAIYDNVRGGLISFAPSGEGWKATTIPTAANSSVGVSAASEVTDHVYYGVEGFLAPSHLWQADAADRRPVGHQGPARPLRRLRRRGRPVRSDVHGWDQDSLLRGPSEGDEAGRLQPDHPLRLRRISGLDAALLFRLDRQAVARARRRVRAGQHPRRRRVRAEVARGRAENPAPARSSTTSPRWRRT